LKTVIRLNLLKFRTSRLIETNKPARANVPYKNAQQIGIIFTVEDKAKHETIKNLIKKFEQDGKQSEVIEFLPEKKDNYEFKFNFFTENDLSFWGNIVSVDALKFIETPFDFLLYLDTSPNPLILHLLARSKAKCRVGRSWSEGHPYFELMIESVGNVNVLAETMYNYITQLR